ncbi:propionate catabolism operon transcriptional regulator [Paraburkholderia sp. BL8N3]|jgi:propionate catabolism operon transcriptional regulator|nr:propionate catabolism operon regulatory protein PrpR [Paraburkholderia sp. BL8N3]TCK36849.1 propionate catabolism operon transcriptional regulator [Paraburkholderia sp. BL8N3]
MSLLASSSTPLAPLAAPATHRPGIALVSISRLRTLCETVAPRYADRARFLSVNQGYGAAVNALEALIDAGSVDVVLAAGSNGAYLRDHLSVPVVTVKVNGFDVLNAITHAIATLPVAGIGLVLHDKVPRELAELSDLLNVRVRCRAYRSIDEVRTAVESLAADGCNVIVGPGMACDVAQRAGLESVLLYSLGAVEEAFDRSVELGLVSRQKEAKRVRLNTIVAHLRDGVAAFDADGQLEAVNPAMLDLLGVDRAHDTAAEVSRAVAPLMSEAGDRDIEPFEQIKQIGERSVIVSCVPIVEHGQPSGTVVTVQDVLVAQRIEQSLRTRHRPRQLVARHRLRDVIGSSAAIERVRSLARRGAAHDVTILLTGESGTGKELVAQGIHNASGRSGNPFVAFNCAALPEGLIESELFGHEEGAFTGARRGGKRGLFEIAHTGTIFLDEIGEMPAALQNRLLRVLQEREVMKLGAVTSTPVDVRVIAATHRDLRALVEQGAFRADLFFRLNLLEIRLPPLRERPADLPELAKVLLRRASSGSRLSTAQIQAVLEFIEPLFRRYDWPGNVRELENVLTRAAIFIGDSPAQPLDTLLPVFPEFGRLRDAKIHTSSAGRDLRHEAAGEGNAAGQRVTRTDVERALRAHEGNRAAASRALGIGRTTLWRIMKG